MGRGEEAAPQCGRGAVPCSREVQLQGRSRAGRQRLPPPLPSLLTSLPSVWAHTEGAVPCRPVRTPGRMDAACCLLGAAQVLPGTPREGLFGEGAFGFALRRERPPTSREARPAALRGDSEAAPLRVQSKAGRETESGPGGRLWLCHRNALGSTFQSSRQGRLPSSQCEIRNISSAPAKGVSGT